MRLLLAEDEWELSRSLKAILTYHHYAVDTVYDGQDALDYGMSGDYDGMILDIMMPKRDGLSVVRQLRARRMALPVLLLTAKSQVEDRVAGLDAGADDYLGKPFSTRELLARIRAMARRQPEYVPDLLSFGDLNLDRALLELSCKGVAQRLTNKEFQMLELFLLQPRCLFTTEQIMQRVWGWDSTSEINVVWVGISSLRRKLAALHSRVEIRAVRGAGYLLEEAR